MVPGDLSVEGWDSARKYYMTNMTILIYNIHKHYVRYVHTTVQKRYKYYELYIHAFLPHE